MADNVNINVTENIDQVNIVASEVVEVVDLNLYATTEDVSINVTEEIIQVNINKVEASNITKTSDLINDGEDGINPFITLNDIPNPPTPTLESVLAEGNETNGYKIGISDGDEITFDNGSRIRKGLTDADNGGAKGVALVCSLDYELKWEAGRQYVMQQDGFTIREVSHNFTITPTATDDETKGFVVGSRWILDNGNVYECREATENNAVWRLTTIDLSGYVPYTGATTNVDLGEFELKAGQLTLDTSPTGTAAVGTTRWNNTLGSSETTLKGGSVILKNGVDLVARVVNKVTPNTTLTKANYAAVRVSGAQGQRLAVAYAQANNDLNSTDTIGLVCETIPTNQEGFILTVGQLENINTTGNLQGENWNDGDVIYLSPTVAGKLTNIKPTAPQHIVIIGYVEYAHANNGKLYVKIMNGWELEELHNVTSTNYTTPIDADSVLTYDVTNSLWKRLSWSNIKSNLKTYFDTIYQAALGYTPENVANKSTNLTSPDNTKYPTTQAVVNKINELSFEEFTLRQTKNIYHFSDFLSNVSDGAWRTTSGAGATFTYTQNTPNNTTFGEISLNTNTTSTTFAQVYFGGTVTGGGSLLRLGNGKFTSVFRCRLSVLSDATNSYGAALMLNTFLNLFHTSGGYYFLYDPQNNFGLGINNGNWWVRNTNAGVFDTGVLATTNYTNFKIETNQNYTEVYFYINNILVRTETNLILNHSCVPGHIGIRKYTGATNASLICDYMGFYYELNTLR